MDTPSELKIDALITATPNLADKPTLANGLPKEELISWRQLHWKLFRSNLEVCSYLSDKPSLANGPPN